jgi:ABC-type bacteriocin/lantibiotic exporter with double-glycine peptidase domain
MHIVYQKDEEGCGIACVAMVAGTTYRKAKDRLPKSWEIKGTTKKQMLKGLQSYAIATGKPKRIDTKDDYKQFEFDAVLHGFLDNELHWTVWDSKRGKLLDPYRPKLKFRCTSFIRIERRERISANARRARG